MTEASEHTSVQRPKLPVFPVAEALEATLFNRKVNLQFTICNLQLNIIYLCQEILKQKNHDNNNFCMYHNNYTY